MKRVVGFVGSYRIGANTDTLVEHVLAGASEQGAATQKFNIARLAIHGCRSCYACRQQPECVQQDDMRALLEEIHAADGVVIGSPAYMWQISGQTKIFLDRLYPLLDEHFKSRLVRRPGLVLAFTQCQKDTRVHEAHLATTVSLLEFLGFRAPTLLIAGGTLAPDDILAQPDTLRRARELGAALAS